MSVKQCQLSILYREYKSNTKLCQHQLLMSCQLCCVSISSQPTCCQLCQHQLSANLRIPRECFEIYKHNTAKTISTFKKLEILLLGWLKLNLALLLDQLRLA